MEEFAHALSGVMRQPVIDATGLTAKYDTELYYGGPEIFAGQPGGLPLRDPFDPRGPRPYSGPDFFDAARTQLGLELKPKKSVVDVLVVDHAEQVPTGN